MNEVAPDFGVRPPWPDELSRVAGTFPALPWNGPMHLQVVVARATPERVVGVAAIATGRAAPAPAAFHLLIRPRFMTAGVLHELCDAVLAAARALRLPALEFGAVLPLTDPRLPALIRAGFRVEEVEGGVRPRWSDGGTPEAL